MVLDKGIDLVMKIWPRLHEEFSRGKLVVVGGGQNDLMEELRQLSAKCGQSIIVAGEVDRPVEYYQMSDVYIFPSHHEGLPTTLMEAMSCGLPSVVSDIGGCRDLVEHGTRRYLNQVDDAESFYKHVRELFWLDAYEHPEHYEDKLLRFTDPLELRVDEEGWFAGRVVMTCCMSDLQYMSFELTGTATENLRAGWATIEAYGRLAEGSYGQQILIVELKSLSRAPAPTEDLVLQAVRG